MSDNQSNRRRYFRIVDTLGVSYRVVNDSEEEGNSVKCIDTASVLNHHNALIEKQIAAVEPDNPELAKLAVQLNEKIDAILMMLELDNLMSQHACHRIDQASISASGIAFPITEYLVPNITLELDMLLRPSAKHVVTLGQVIECKEMSEAGTYYLRVEFTEMTEPNRETLIQHIVQRQGVLLRALKGSQYDDETS